jgi:hypothetical protein
MTIFHCLRFETPPTWRSRSPYLRVYPLGTGWPGCTPRHWVLFSSPPTTLRATVKAFEPANRFSWSSLYKHRHRQHSTCCRGNVFTAPLPSNGRIYSLHYSGLQPSCHNIKIQIILIGNALRLQSSAG